MGSFSIWHWVVVLVVVLVLFGGGGKLSRLMGDMAKGVNAFKKGLKENDDAASDGEGRKTIDNDTAASSAETPEKDGAAKS